VEPNPPIGGCAILNARPVLLVEAVETKQPVLDAELKI
jgi:hypothetical protein